MEKTSKQMKNEKAALLFRSNSNQVLTLILVSQEAYKINHSKNGNKILMKGMRRIIEESFL